MKDLSLDALYAYYHLIDSTLKKTLVFGVSRFYTEKKSSTENTGNLWRPWDKVADHLYLGKIPSLSSYIYSMADQHEQLIDFIKKEKDSYPLGMVVSVVDYFELAGHAVVSPSCWEQKNIKHYLLPISDFTANVSNESVIAIIEEMKQCIESGKSVYVHCKAGRSRSAMICAIYLGIYGEKEGLILNEDEDIEKIEDYLIQKRPQVDLNEDQRKKAVEIIRIMKQEEKIIENNQNNNNNHLSNKNEVDKVNQINQSLDLKESLNEILGSLSLKNAIIYFSSFKKLAIYACKNQGYVAYSQSTEGVKAFFKNIYYATNSDWYVELLNSKQGPMQQFVDADPYTLYLWSSDKKERATLCEDFIKELNAYLAQALNCSLTDIENAVKEFGTQVYDFKNQEKPWQASYL